MSALRKPVYLLAGGHGSRRKSPDPLVQTVFRDSGVPKPSVAYVGAASGDDRSFYNFIASALKDAGAGPVRHALMASERADLKKAKNILESSDIIFISGGDVEAGMEVLQQKNMAYFLVELYHKGKPFFGISAGSIMLAREWIRWRDPEDDATAEIFPCLGIAPVICDTHAEEDGWEELIALLGLEGNGAEGYGIPSGAAIRVSPDGQAAGMGSAVACFVRRGDKVEKAADLLPPA